MDDEELQKGNEITSSLVKAIKESRIFIIVLSADYASSSFCLDELLQIIDCVKQKDRLVLPVFYNVDPCDVRYQINSFARPMAKHEERFKNDNVKVQKWRMALKRVADLSGYHLKQGDGQYEHKFIEEIVEDISRKIEREPLPVADHPVGLDSDMSNVISLLDIESKDSVHIVGIHGIGGIGKTTLAVAIYNSIADHFQNFCFLEDVKGISKSHGLGYLQELLLSELLGKDQIKSRGVRDATTKIHRALGQKKVLLVLDNVDSENQLEAIVGKLDWFCPGSRIIITTRDKQLLISNGVEKTYEVEGLNHADALELLIWKAFKTSKVDSSYTDVLNRVVAYACGLPLVLQVIGPALRGKSVQEWNSAINQYERIPHNEIHEKLKISYDALQEEEKSVFLDIACCFKGYELAEVEDILRAHHGSCMKYHIGVLVEKSLVKISRYGKVTLHDLIEKLGKEIVRRESPKPEKRSRLWYYEDIVRILKHNQISFKLFFIFWSERTFHTQVTRYYFVTAVE
ncbi:hypothetical protein PIB30_004293 [Stylosanthes scabra]|uniref:TIR domain-containing protein n=1 Tax=Stylosanthes scabra TaxID=79078 RepID=A0ABU6T5A9_9FABA|nr:hypothetical protein [Stylosanthes scabra]